MPRKLKDDAMYGITLHVDGINWVVAITRNRQKFTKSFSFFRWGERELALQAAQAWRDDIVRRHKPEKRVDRARTLRSHNTSGITGVSCYRSADGTPVQWIAITSIVGIGNLRRRFSVSRYGFEQAKQLAIEARERQLKKMKGRSYLPNDYTPPPVASRAASIKPLPEAQRKRRFAEILRPQNMKSGIAGVRIERHAETSIRAERESWVAVVGQRRKFFSVEKYGYDAARALAVAARQAYLDSIWVDAP